MKTSYFSLVLSSIALCHAAALPVPQTTTALLTDLGVLGALTGIPITAGAVADLNSGDNGIEEDSVADPDDINACDFGNTIEEDPNVDLNTAVGLNAGAVDC
jgi:hypothetical protein